MEILAHTATFWLSIGTTLKLLYSEKKSKAKKSSICGPQGYLHMQMAR